MDKVNLEYSQKFVYGGWGLQQIKLYENMNCKTFYTTILYKRLEVLHHKDAIKNCLGLNPPKRKKRNPCN
jgi:hypothetical protein